VSGGGQQSPTIWGDDTWHAALRSLDAAIEAHRKLDFDAFLLTNYSGVDSYSLFHLRYIIPENICPH